MRFSVGAVNIPTGNFVYFNNTLHRIGPEHVMASGALQPGFPPVEIEGEHYWDGGLVSNTPLQRVLESEPRQDTLAFQVDLWSARGAFPRTMAEVATRQKEIQLGLGPMWRRRQPRVPRRLPKMVVTEHSARVVRRRMKPDTSGRA
jgi:NTE family protein